MTNSPPENILPAENYIISLFIAVTNYLLIYSIYSEKQWMTKTETTASKPATKELSSQWIPIEKPLRTIKNI